MLRRYFLAGTALALGTFAAGGAFAQGTVKIGLILPMTGQQASTGKQIAAAVKLFQAQNGDTVAGKKIEVILKDDGAVPDNTKRLAQELIVNDKVTFLAGFGVTPAALAVAPLATEAKVPEIVMAAGTSIITERSPYIVRTSFTLAQSSGDHRRLGGQERHQEGRDHGVRLCAGRSTPRSPSRSASPRPAARCSRRSAFPLANPDFAPFLQRAARRQARRDLRVRAVRPGRRLRQAVHRARPRQGRHQAHRPRRRHRRRPAQRHGRPGDRHRDGAFLLGGAQLAG